MLAAGTRIGSYTIESAIGAGGMGEVYRATDSKLKRQVAIKVLPSALATDGDRLARFQREAELLAALNHPGIAAIYGLEDTDNLNALVMELVEGPTLADRIARGALPVNEALIIARQIAEALESAHAQGIVHRDLKPANIKVRDDGTVKVLDFGLAKALSREPVSSAALSHSPTITSPATHAGVILGTAAYMSPEQARGKPLDSRTDIWSFGCVLYEMLSGRRAFEGEDTSEVLASILAREPDFSALPASTPPAIRRLLQRSLAKDRHERLRDIGDVRIELRDALADLKSGSPVDERRVPRSRLREGVAWAIAGAAVIIAALMLWQSGAEPPSREMRVEVSLPAGTQPLSPVLSPDGRSIAFTSTADGRSRLWLHSFDSGVARPMRGTDGANFPFWSPDSRHIGFFADNRLKRIEVESESVQVVDRAPTRGANGSWSVNDEIVLVSLGRPIQKVSASGGPREPVPGLVQQGSNFSLSFLPDGRRFLYYVRGTPEVRGVYAGDVVAPIEPRRLVDADSGAVYLPSGYLLFTRQGTLLAQRFDPATLQVSGTAAPVADRVASTVSRAGVSTSATGAILFRRGGSAPRQQFIWFDRSGRELERIGGVGGGSSPALSADGQHVVFYRASDGGNPDIWSLDLNRGLVSKLTNDAADDTAPIWSPDGRRIVFGSNRAGTHTIFQKPFTAGAPETALFSSPDQKTVTDWSRDGRFLLFNGQSPQTSFDVWALPMGGDQKPFAIAATEFDEAFARFSPDGRWIAYQSDESGRDEIYVQPFQREGDRVQVSSAGGTQPRWRDDGKELFYVALDEQLMAVSIGPKPGASSLDVGKPAALFAAPLGGAVQQADFRPQYMVSPDGQRFLMAAITPATNTPATLILNWSPSQP